MVQLYALFYERHATSLSALHQFVALAGALSHAYPQEVTGTHQKIGSGLPFALGAHAIWGSMPIYLILVKAVPSLEFVAWRLIFTLPLCLAIVALRRQGAQLVEVLRNRKALLTLLGSSAMIAINWFLYVWAIQNDHVYAASLGYYILPLIMMLLGLLVLGERLTRRQWAAVTLAGIGVAALAGGALTTLWISLSMAITFAVYGLLRKTVAAGALVGLTVESFILLPLSLAILAWFWATPEGPAMGQSLALAIAIMGSGPMTATPLLLFATAARRMPYTVIGFLQFLSPTIVFLLGMFVFGEELHPAQLACFAAIWAAAALFIWDLVRSSHRARQDQKAASSASA